MHHHGRGAPAEGPRHRRAGGDRHAGHAQELDEAGPLPAAERVGHQDPRVRRGRPDAEQGRLRRRLDAPVQDHPDGHRARQWPRAGAAVLGHLLGERDEVLPAGGAAAGQPGGAAAREAVARRDQAVPGAVPDVAGQDHRAARAHPLLVRQARAGDRLLPHARTRDGAAQGAGRHRAQVHEPAGRHGARGSRPRHRRVQRGQDQDPRGHGRPVARLRPEHRHAGGQLRRAHGEGQHHARLRNLHAPHRALWPLRQQGRGVQPCHRKRRAGDRRQDCRALLAPHPECQVRR
mmetsp:Transcript_3392/g.13697  ORF Transcript_3392/g.13697 Transcript_3392/m.13697 type:complete len:290 (-) Transcript_3392:131-1000(-)